MLQKLLFAIFLFSVSLLANYARANAILDSKLSEKLAQDGSANIMVVLKDSADLQSANLISDRAIRAKTVRERLLKVAELSQAPVINWLEGRGLKFRAFYVVNAISVDGISQSLAEELARQPGIARLDLNAKATLKLPPQTKPTIEDLPTASRLQKNLTVIKVDQVWEQLKAKGKGIVLAGQDSGYMWQHEALKNAYRGFSNGQVNHNYNWHDSIHVTGSSCGADAQEPCDDDGHGTHTMGSMLGDDGRDNKIGVAPEAKWIGCRNMNNGVGTVATYLECFEFFLAPYPVGGNSRSEGRVEMAPHIINNSWSCPPKEGCRADQFVDAIRALTASGILMVVAAGNDGPGCGSLQDPPGTYNGLVLSVAAYDDYYNSIASFSSRGPSTFDGSVGIDLAAPGTLIRSSVPKGDFGGGKYDYKQGTSMASPHVAGAVALLWQHRPELLRDVNGTIAFVRRNADGRTNAEKCANYSGVPNTSWGYGLLDTYKLLTGK